MNRAEKFYKYGVRNAQGFDLVTYFKMEVTKGGYLSNSRLAAEYYAKLVAEIFELNDMKEDFTKLFYRFHQNQWSNGKYRRYNIRRFKTILGITEYRRVNKVFKSSKVKVMLESAGIHRVGFVTFVNMVCYIIYKQNYSE